MGACRPNFRGRLRVKPPPFFDDFDYGSGDLVGQGGWTTAGIGSSVVLTANTVLNFPGNRGAVHTFPAVPSRRTQGKWEVELFVTWTNGIGNDAGNVHVILGDGTNTLQLTCNFVDDSTGEVEIFNGGGASGGSAIPLNTSTFLRWIAPGDGNLYCYTNAGLANTISLGAVPNFVPNQLRMDGIAGSGPPYNVQSIYFGDPKD